MPEEEKKNLSKAAEQAAVAEKAEPKAEKPAKKAKDEGPGREPPPPGGIADLFAKALPDVQLEAYQGMTDVIIEVGRDDIPKVMQAAKEDPQLNLNFLRSLFGVDHMEEGLEVVYQLFSYDKKHGVTIKTRLPADDAKVASVTPVWKGANWHERETRDMFGIDFEGHPHLEPLLLPEDMTDHFPLRKDNPLAEIEEWQGDLLVEDEAESKE
jgi:NADH-quinone oxidoreductase subunit C